MKNEKDSEESGEAPKNFKKYTKYKYPACISSIFNSYDALKTAIEQKQYLYQSVKLIRYEDLIDSGEDIIREIWKFIGLSTNLGPISTKDVVKVLPCSFFSTCASFAFDAFCSTIW